VQVLERPCLDPFLVRYCFSSETTPDNSSAHLDPFWYTAVLVRKLPQTMTWLVLMGSKRNRVEDEVGELGVCWTTPGGSDIRIVLVDVHTPILRSAAGFGDLKSMESVLPRSIVCAATGRGYLGNLAKVEIKTMS
jgi:hypothetical protein